MAVALIQATAWRPTNKSLARCFVTNSAKQLQASSHCGIGVGNLRWRHPAIAHDLTGCSLKNGALHLLRLPRELKSRAVQCRRISKKCVGRLEWLKLARRRSVSFGLVPWIRRPARIYPDEPFGGRARACCAVAARCPEGKNLADGGADGAPKSKNCTKVTTVGLPPRLFLWHHRWTNR